MYVIGIYINSLKKEIFFCLKLKNYPNLLSIIIPAYNAKKTLSKCINSLINQKVDWIEIIIIDDKSTDQSFLIYNKYKKILGGKKFKVFYCKNNKGPGYCRNIGIKKASGRFVAFLDSDDYFLDRSLIKLKNILLNFKPDILINNNLRNKKPFSNNFYFRSFKNKIYKKNEFLKKCIKNNININECWKIIVKRKILEKNLIKFPNVYIGEDQCFVIDAILHSKTFFINKEPLIYHYSSPSGLASSNIKVMTESFIFLLNYFYKKNEQNKLQKYFIFKKIEYLKQNLNIVLLNENKNKINIIFKKFINNFSSKKHKVSNKNLIKILSNYKNFNVKIHSSLPKNISNNFKIFIFSNNFLGKSLKRFIHNNNLKVKYIFDDNLKFKLIELEKYNFNYKILNIFYVAITDQKIFNKIKKRIYNLNFKKNLVKIIKLF